MSSTLLENLIAQNIISPAGAASVEKTAAKPDSNLSRALEDSNLVDPDQLLKAKAAFFGLPSFDLSTREIPKEVLNIVPQDLAENYELAAFNKKDNVLDIALADPGNFKAREAIEFFGRKNNLKIRYFVCSYKSLTSALKQYSTLTSEVGEALTQAETKFKTSPKKESPGKEEFEEVIKSAPVAKMVSVILNHAVDGRASDIHIEPMEDKTRVRYRIDGDLHTSLILPQYIHSAIVSRIKVLAGLKIDETRIPQDGHIRHQEGKIKIDLRVSTIPLSEGEKVVMRILKADTPPSLKELGFIYHDLEVLERSIKKPNGMFLVTGPTGSGKSTTLFSVLNILNQEDVNISTLEDPVEYHVEGVNQSQINPDVKFTFASGLRALLRQDPDIIMVGEIRDNETAELAVHAALTGHIVLATLHTNDAFGAIPRLIDMKVEPFLLVSTVNAILAQRLVRRLCPYCRKEIKTTETILKAVNQELIQVPKPEKFQDIDFKNPKFFSSPGCDKCRGVGFEGRVAVSETLELTARLKEIILSGLKLDQVGAEKKAQGMLSLRQDGIIKAMQGLVSLEEVFSVTSEER